MNFLILTVFASVFASSYGKSILKDKKTLNICSRIIGGEDAKIEEYPFMVQVGFYGLHICGGSIISNSWVLTAAHCVFEAGEDDDSLTVRVGSSYANSKGEVIAVKKSISHGNYDPKILDYDVALLNLYSILEFGSKIYPINLPNPNQNFEVGRSAKALGWGTTETNKDFSILDFLFCEGKMLKVVELPLLSNEQCQKYMTPYKRNVTERMMCAGYIDGGKDSCQGDSGGPLVVGHEQIGIVSWGLGCAKPNLPGVYTNVVSIRDFINSTAGI